jgi:hypothetical protein
MTTLSDLLPRLTEPFPSDLIELKPGALTQSQDRALALAYADSRVYQDRLDQVVGPANWSVAFSLHTAGAICTLTICGVTKSDVGDFPLDYSDKANENRATTAAAQAFKRACAQFGLGRYLYTLPHLWADYDRDRKLFLDPSGLVRRLYHTAGLAAFVSAPASSAAQPSAALPAQLSRPADPQRLATARAALAEAERTTATATPSDRASDAQLGLIARLIIGLRQAASDEDDTADALDALGERFQLADLADQTSKERLRAYALAKTTASALIQELKALEQPTTLAA